MIVKGLGREILGKSSLRFALVYPPFDDQRDRRAYYVAPPLGLLSIAAYLERAGHEVTVHDFIYDLRAGRLASGPGLYRDCAERISARDPDVVGFSTQCSTSPGSVNIARHLKQIRPETAILLGGHDVSFLAQDYLRAFEFIDFVLAGEAELTAPDLAAAILGQREFSGVPGLAWRDPGGVAQWNPGARRVDDLDSMPSPSYHLVDEMPEYFRLSKRATMLIDSGRGCAFGCAFCQTTRLTGPKVRYRSVDSLIAELKEYRRLYGEFQAYFVHDLFTARRSFVERLSQRLIQEDLRLDWLCRCRLDQVDRPLLALMRQAGCTMLLYGVESGSEITLARMNKRFRPGLAGHTVERARWTVEQGIQPSMSMVVGTPGENQADLNSTMALAARLAQVGRARVFVQLLSPLPGTEMAERVFSRLVYRGQDVPTAFSQGIEFCNGKRLEEDERLIRAWPRLFQCFYAVLPDDGDLDLRADVCQAYTRLLEVYARTFDALALASGGHLDLFQEFRREALAGGLGDRGLRHLPKTELWDGFARFARRRIGEPDAPEPLMEALRFEQLLGQISRLSPVRETGTTLKPRQRVGGPIRLHPAARLFRTRCPAPWMGWGEAGAAGGELCLLVYATPERLACVQLLPELADAIEFLEKLNEDGEAGPAIYSRLARLLAPVIPLGVFERSTPPYAGAAATPALELATMREA